MTSSWSNRPVRVFVVPICTNSSSRRGPGARLSIEPPRDQKADRRSDGNVRQSRFDIRSSSVVLFNSSFSRMPASST